MIPDTTVLNAKTIAEIVKMGYTRIPVFSEGDKNNVTDILFVKVQSHNVRLNINNLNISKDLALLDPDDNFTVKTVCGYHKHPVKFVFNDTPLSVLLEAFKKGEGHLAMVKKLVGAEDHDPSYELVGVVTLEDIVEEILQAYDRANGKCRFTWTYVWKTSRIKLHGKEPQFDAEFESVIRIQNRSFQCKLQSIVHSIRFVTTNPERYCRFLLSHTTKIIFRRDDLSNEGNGSRSPSPSRRKNTLASLSNYRESAPIQDPSALLVPISTRQIASEAKEAVKALNSKENGSTHDEEEEMSLLLNGKEPEKA
uniref:CBS domain-containing protein n=1 Tax=Heterorhabditis bacteriophora TaxID=37862 RepID=A0A1I7X4M6_HETBA